MTRHVRFTLDPSLPVSAPDSVAGVLRGRMDGEDRIHGADNTMYSLREVRLLPCVTPSKIVCVGRNYADHAKELGNAVPAEPIIFLKPPSSLNAAGAPIVYPKLSQLVSFEGELGLVIGKQTRNISAADAWDSVAGFTLVNDVTARDLQKKDGQWTRGKGFDSFCPVGPWWSPKEEFEFGSFRVSTSVNGSVKQDAPVTDMLFPVGVILEYISQFMTLEPGDLIATGTPPGVGPLQPGDVVRVEISGLGALENPVIAE